jgi:hypothetical protein
MVLMRRRAFLGEPKTEHANRALHHSPSQSTSRAKPPIQQKAAELLELRRLAREI